MTQIKHQLTKGLELEYNKEHLEYSDNPKKLTKLLKDITTVFKYDSLNTYFSDDKEQRTIVLVSMTRGNRSIDFKYGLSLCDTSLIEHGKILRTSGRVHQTFAEINKAMHELKNGMYYGVLACCKSDYYIPPAFIDFVNEFGYTDTLKTRLLHDSCLIQAKKVQTIFTEQEINYLPS